MQRSSNYRRLFWALSAFTAAVRLLIIGGIGLSGDEAHYWTYTRYLDLSYFDHPPLVGYLIKLSTLVFGNSEFAVRFPTVLIFFAVSWVVFLIARRLFDDRAAFWSVVLLNIAPVFSFLGAVLTVPDAPLSLFWILFAWLFLKTVQADGSTAGARNWYGMGVLLGLGLLSKYNAVLLVPSVALFLLVSKRHRFWLARMEPYIALLIAAVLFLPVVVWNMENGWASFGFQMQHGFGKTLPVFSGALLGRNLGAQAGYLSPVLFIIYWSVLVLLIVRYVRKKDERALFIVSFSLPTLFLFNAISSFNEILPHWPAMGYLILTIGVADAAVRGWTSRGWRATFIAAGALGLLLTVLVPLQALFKVLPAEIFLPKDEAARIEDGITRAEKVDITNELYGWREVGDKITEIASRAPGPRPFIFTHRHYVASQLSFYTPGHPRIFTLSERIDAFDFWQRDLMVELDGRDGIFVTNDYFYVDPRTIYPFVSWDEPVTLDIHRNGRKIRRFWITYGRNIAAGALPHEYTSEAAGPRLTFMEAVRKADYTAFWFINRGCNWKVINSMMWRLTAVDVGLGINMTLVVLILLVGMVLWRTRREKFLPEMILVIGIIGIGGVVVHFMKDFFDRMRPLSLFGDQVRVFKELFYRGSFPSGHTQIAFAVATYLTSRVKRYWWAFFGMATLMGLSRVYIGVHFPIDVLAGAVVGVAVALLMMKLIKID